MKITLSNKEFELDNLNNEQEAKLAEFLSAMQAEDDPFDIRKGDTYWFVNGFGHLCDYCCNDGAIDKSYVKQGKACKDRDLLEQLESRAVLTRLMWIYSIRHGGRELLDKEAWEHEDVKKYYCSFNSSHNTWVVDYLYWYRDNEAYFIDRQTAENCIKEVVIPYCAAHPKLGYN